MAWHRSTVQSPGVGGGWLFADFESWAAGPFCRAVSSSSRLRRRLPAPNWSSASRSSRSRESAGGLPLRGGRPADLLWGAGRRGVGLFLVGGELGAFPGSVCAFTRRVRAALRDPRSASLPLRSALLFSSATAAASLSRRSQSASAASTAHCARSNRGSPSTPMRSPSGKVSMRRLMSSRPALLAPASATALARRASVPASSRRRWPRSSSDQETDKEAGSLSDSIAVRVRAKAARISTAAWRGRLAGRAMSAEAAAARTSTAPNPSASSSSSQMASIRSPAYGPSDGEARANAPQRSTAAARARMPPALSISARSRNAPTASASRSGSSSPAASTSASVPAVGSWSTAWSSGRPASEPFSVASVRAAPRSRTCDSGSLTPPGKPWSSRSRTSHSAASRTTATAATAPVSRSARPAYANSTATSARCTALPTAVGAERARPRARSTSPSLTRRAAAPSGTSRVSWHSSARAALRGTSVARSSPPDEEAAAPLTSASKASSWANAASGPAVAARRRSRGRSRT